MSILINVLTNCAKTCLTKKRHYGIYKRNGTYGTRFVFCTFLEYGSCKPEKLQAYKKSNCSRTRLLGRKYVFSRRRKVDRRILFPNTESNRPSCTVPQGKGKSQENDVRFQIGNKKSNRYAVRNTAQANREYAKQENAKLRQKRR